MIYGCVEIESLIRRLNEVESRAIVIKSIVTRKCMEIVTCRIQRIEDRNIGATVVQHAGVERNINRTTGKERGL